MSWLVAAPIALPLATGALLLVGRFSPQRERAIALLSTSALALLSIALLSEVSREGILVLQAGGWSAPFGISLVADRLGAAMVVITGVIGLAVVVYAMADLDARRLRFGFHGLMQVMLGGVCGAFLTGDVFNLYVWFEVMLIASFALLVLGGERAQLDGALKYVALNLVATVLFLSGAGLLYGMTGTLNMADLHGKLAGVENQGLVTAVAVMFMVAFGIKAAMFPLFFWLPASYHTPPVAVSALFAGLLTKVGVYALIRFFTLIFTQDVEYTHGLLAVASGLTMLTGVLGAAAQSEFRRILGFHIVSQIGYMVMGLALGTPLGLAGAIFYVLHHIIVKANLFLVSGVARRLGGSFELAELGGFYRRSPLFGVLFLIPAFSLAGFPPLSGFWAKLMLVRAGLDLGAWWVVAVLLIVGLLTVYSMTKIWAEVFWKEHPTRPGGLPSAPRELGRAERACLLLPVVGLALLTVAIGLWPAPLLALAEGASRELLDPMGYVERVLGGARP
jgi:multicomponent Na+:H+ antiporter subunit D